MTDSHSRIPGNKKTKLHAWHMAASANMAKFGAYEMPMWYPAGVRSEHLAVLTAAGLFDTSHMAALHVRGRGGIELLQKCFSRDIRMCLGGRPLRPGRCVYGVFPDEAGGVIDDAVIYMLAENDFMAVVNAGMGGVIAAHLETHRSGANIEITDLSDTTGKLDLQGPASAKILSRLIESPAAVFDRLFYFSFKGGFSHGSRTLGNSPVRLRTGEEIMLSRSGYTGEFGFEIFTSGNDFIRIWEAIVTAGEPFGLLPCGLAARDSLRTGARLPLSHQDIGPWPFVRHPWEFALPYRSDKNAFTKTFIGDRALLTAVDVPFTFAFIGSDLRKVSAGRDTRVLTPDGEDIGHVLTCATDVGIGCHEERIYSIASPDKPENFQPRGLSCGFLRIEKELLPGDVLTLSDQRRKIHVKITGDIRPHRTARRPIREFT